MVGFVCGVYREKWVHLLKFGQDFFHLNLQTILEKAAGLCVAVQGGYVDLSQYGTCHPVNTGWMLCCLF